MADQLRRDSKGGNILGLKAFESVKDISKNIELALIMVPANFVKEAVQDCADAKGTKSKDYLRIKM